MGVERYLRGAVLKAREVKRPAQAISICCAGTSLQRPGLLSDHLQPTVLFLSNPVTLETAPKHLELASDSIARFSNEVRDITSKPPGTIEWE
jgi:hypothetical protein